MACKDEHHGTIWTSWDAQIGIETRMPERVVGDWCGSERLQVLAIRILPAVEQLKIYCGQRGIRFMGDVPIYVAHDSADIWLIPICIISTIRAARRGLRRAARLFSATGQLWGNPIYRWTCWPPADTSGGSSASVPRSRFSIWCDSIISVALNLTGSSRRRTTAIHGRWIKGREKIFCRHCRTRFADYRSCGKPRRDYSAVEKLRQQFGLPGMSLLQFAFGTDPQGHRFFRIITAATWSPTLAATTMTQPWMVVEFGCGRQHAHSGRCPQRTRLRARVSQLPRRFEINWVMIRAVLASVADVAIVPLARCAGPWQRSSHESSGHGQRKLEMALSSGALSGELGVRLRSLVTMYDR